MKRAFPCAVLALALFAAPAGAQHHRGSPHDHDHPPGPHGGRVEGAGAWHAELVTQDGTVAVYLTDGDGKPLPTEGFSAVAILKSGNKAMRIPLSPEGGRLTGKTETALGERPTGAVRITAPGGAAASARFD